MKKTAIPFHPLVDQQPADTLSHIQTMLRFAQECSAQAIADPQTPPQQIRMYNQFNGILRMINEALDYEIERLEHYGPLDAEKEEA